MNFRKKISAFALAAMLCANSCSVFASEAFDVDFAPGTPIVDAIRSLGYRANKNIVINGDLSGTVALSLTNTNFGKAIDVLALTHGFSYEYKGDVVLVSPSKTMSIMETFNVKHLDLEAAKKQMELILDEDKIFVNADNNTISVNGSTAQIDKVRDQLKQLDVAQPQIQVQATVVELSRNKARDMGLNFSSEGWSKDTAVSGYNGIKFGITANHEETLSKGKILARPSVTVFNGRKALIMMGDKVPVFTSSSTSSETTDNTVTVDYKDVGVKLEAIPRINDDGDETITMTIKPSISTITQWVESGNNKAPQISTREAETIVRVRSGETIFIGGLLKDEEVKNIKAIPFLSKLPVLGEIFKSRSTEKKNTEILIAITPTIVRDEFGRPKVEMQQTSPALHKEITTLQDERMNHNISSEQQKTLEVENAALEAKLKKMEAEKEALEKEKAELRKNKATVEKELKKTTDTMKKFIEKARE
mgnify:FL=1